jgi:hypothetical protein
MSPVRIAPLAPRLFRDVDKGADIETFKGFSPRRQIVRYEPYGSVVQNHKAEHERGDRRRQPMVASVSVAAVVGC